MVPLAAPPLAARPSREDAGALGPPAPLAADARAAAQAVLRWRAWWLGHHLPRRQALAARLLPVMLHASFPAMGLSGEAPGVAGLRYRRRWSALARDLGLPPPSGMQRGRCLVEAVIACPTPEGLDALVLVAAGTRTDDLGPLQERLEAVQRVLSPAAAAPVRAGLYTAARLHGDPEAAQRALAFGALLAGTPGREAWVALEEGARQGGDPALLRALAAAAPTPLASLALALLSDRRAPGPLPALLSLLLEGERPRRLADPELFAVRWAGRVPALREPLEKALRLARRPSADEPGDLSEVLALGRTLALACTLALRRRGGRVDRQVPHLRREILGPGVPRVLLPALGARLRLLEDGAPPPLEPVRDGHGYEVRAGGCVLGRGLGPVQARVRALGLWAQARAAGGGELPGLSSFDPTWRVVVQRLGGPPGRASAIMVVEAGGGSRPGPPFDPLNRGVERAMEFEGGLLVSTLAGRRPSGRMVGPEEAVEAVLRRSTGEAAPEVLASRVEARPVASRLAQVAALAADPGGDSPLAVEAGGRVYVPFRGGLRRYRLERFAARPRRFRPDPESPDLALGAGERTRAGQASHLLQCKVTLAGDEAAALLYADGAGGLFRERVALAELEEHLAEARAVVREARPRSALTLRLADEVEGALRRTDRRQGALAVSVRGALPRVEVEVAGERFGGLGPMGWDAAAQALLAIWPARTEGRLRIGDVAVTLAGVTAPPLLALWAASVARRRLHTRLFRLTSAYRPPLASRLEW